MKATYGRWLDPFASLTEAQVAAEALPQDEALSVEVVAVAASVGGHGVRLITEQERREVTQTATSSDTSGESPRPLEAAWSAT